MTNLTVASWPYHIVGTHTEGTKEVIVGLQDQEFSYYARLSSHVSWLWYMDWNRLVISKGSPLFSIQILWPLVKVRSPVNSPSSLFKKFRSCSLRLISSSRGNTQSVSFPPLCRNSGRFLRNLVETNPRAREKVNNIKIITLMEIFTYSFSSREEMYV